MNFGHFVCMKIFSNLFAALWWVFLLWHKDSHVTQMCHMWHKDSHVTQMCHMWHKDSDVTQRLTRETDSHVTQMCRSHSARSLHSYMHGSKMLAAFLLQNCVFWLKLDVFWLQNIVFLVWIIVCVLKYITLWWQSFCKEYSFWTYLIYSCLFWYIFMSLLNRELAVFLQRV